MRAAKPAKAIAIVHHRGQRAGLGTGVGLSAHRPRLENGLGMVFNAHTVDAHDERRRRHILRLYEP
jgi:hypothetical protein